MSLIKDLKSSLSRIEAAELTWKGSLLKELMTLRKEGVTTDTRVMVVGEEGSTTLLAHSLVLAAASPTLATILSSCSQEEDFTLVLPGGDAIMVEQAINKMYLGNLPKNPDPFTLWGVRVKGEQDWEDSGGSEEEDDFDAASIDCDDAKSEIDVKEEVGREESEKRPLRNNTKDEKFPPNSEHMAEKKKRSERKVYYEPNADWEDDAANGADDDWKDDADSQDWDNKTSEMLEARNPLIPGAKKRKGNLGKEEQKEECTVRGKSVSITPEGMFQCPHCDKQFEQKNRLTIHIKDTHVYSPCEHCGKVFNSVKSLMDHISRKHSHTFFYCDKCDYKAKAKRDLKVHHESKHEETRHICPHCGKSYSHKHILNVHVRQKHTDPQTFYCDQCDYTCIGFLEQLKTHKEMKHGPTQFICLLCSFVTNSGTDLENHKLVNHKDNTELAQLLSPSKINAKKRKEREALIDYTCKQCNIKKNSRQSLKAHMQMVHEGRRFKCTVEGCSDEKTTKRGLEDHINTIHLGKRFKCEKCDAIITTESNLRNHMRRIHGAVMFACDKCTLKCWSSEKMQNHMLIHQ